MILHGEMHDKTGYSFNVAFGSKIRKSFDFEWPPKLIKTKPVAVKDLAVGIVNTSDKEETVKLDVSGFEVAGKPAQCFVIADPQNDPQGFNDPDKPQRIAIVETELESFEGSVVVKPYSVTLLRF